MAATFTKIATVTVGAGGASNIEFTSIDSSYTDLCLKVSARGTNNTSNSYIWYTISLNNSTSSFSSRFVQYDYGSAVSGSNTTIFGMNNLSNFTANAFASNEHYFPNYGSSNYKSISSEYCTETNSSDGVAGLMAVLWSNTSAISSIKITPQLNNFAQYSSATLYGIKNS